MSRTDHLSELESLRSQVAELSRTLAEQDQSMQNLHEQSDLLRAIVEGTASATGGEFFRSLVHHLARALNVRYVFVGEWHEERPERVRTLAVWLGTAFGESFEYDLKNAPCNNVLGQQLCFYPRDVQQCFPEDRLLAEMGVASYCGAPLFDRSANPLGLLVVMDDRPMTNPRIVEDLLKIFASRAAAELERARAEQERNQALADVYNVIEAIPDIVFALNTQGNLMKWNRRLVDVTGYSPEELLNKPALAFVPPEEQTHTATAIQRAFTEGYAELEGHLLTKDHRLIPYHWTGALLKNSQGEPLGITGVGRDVSDKKQAEEALRMSEERLALAVEGSSDILWDAHRLPGEPWYAPQTPIWWSPRVRELLGLEESESFETLEQWAAMLHPDDKDRVFGQLAAHIEHRVPYDAEYRLRTNRGDYLWIRGRGQASWDEQGEIRRMSGSCQDFTERKRMEEERQKQEVLISLMLNTGPACIKRVAADGSLLHMNPTGLKLVEACEGLEVVGRSVFDLVISEHRVAFIDMHRSVIEGHERTLQFEIQGLKGTRRWMESYAAPFRNPVTGQTEQLAVTHDITGRKQVEEALRESETFNISVLNSLSAQIVVLDSQGVIIAVNTPWLRFAEENGAPHLVESSVGMSYLNVCAQAAIYANGEEAASAQAGILAVLAGTQNEFSLEYPCHSPDQQRWFRMRVTPLLDSQAGVVVAHENITERKLTELALREREEVLVRFKATLDQTHDCVFMFAPDTLSFIYCNRGAVEQVGYSEVELFTMTPLDLKPEFTERSFREMLQKLKDGRMDSHVFETIHRHKDGHDVAVEISLQLVREEGEEGRFLAVVRDITERKQAEKALRESEERFDLAVRGSNTGVWDWDLRTDKTYFSPLWKSMLGYEEHELRGDLFEWEERLHPDDRKRSSATIRAYLEGGTPQYELEHRLHHKDGSYRWILARGVSLSDAEGKPYRMAGSHIDITEQKQIQEALAQSERQLRTVLDALPVGVWFTDRSGKPLLANPVAKKIWSNIKQIGLQNSNSSVDWRETVELATGPHRWALSHALTTGVSSLNETLELESFDGTKTTIRNSTVPIHDEAGIILGAIVLNEDITLLRQAQAALQLTQFSVDHAVEGFFWIDPDARILNVNEAACRMLEYTREELTAMTVHDIDPALPHEVWPAYWADLREKGSLTFESKHWSRTGRVLEMEVTFNYLQYEGNEYSCAIMRDIGERKRVQSALRASEERYHALYDETPTMYFTLATDGTVLSVNRFGAEQLGYQVEELIGHSVLGLFHEGDKEVAAASLSECLATPERTKHWEFRKVRKDGSVIWVRETVHVGQSSTGETIVLATCEDITERKQFAEREAARVRQLKKLYELSMTLSGDPGVVLEHVVRAIGELFNVQVVCLSEIIGQELYFKSVYVNGQTFMDAGHCSLAITPCAAVEQTKDLRIFDRVIERFPQASFLRDYQAVSYCGFPALDNEGCVVAVTCLLDNKPHEFSKEEQDLLRIFGQRIAAEMERSRHAAEQKRAEEELRKSHAFIRQIIDTDPNFIFAKDREGRFVLVNKAVADVYGTTVDDVIGKTDADFNPNQEEVAFFRQKDLAVMDTLHELFLPEEVITDSGGRTRWLQTVKRPILDDEGRATMVLGASTDITERKRMEAVLRQRERDLCAAIEERERISQDLHDGILQSLFAVGLALETAKSMMSASVRKQSGQPLDQAINQLNYVMREIRNFIAGLGSDLLQGKDLTMVLQQMLASLTENQSTNVRLAVEDRAAKALSTEQSLHLIRVIQEAVSNCIQHGHASEARVSLKLLKQGVRLSVRDNGCGFNQAGAKRTGHGLRNMASRAKKIGGKFSVLSKVNEGTRIVFDVPRETADVSR